MSKVSKIIYFIFSVIFFIFFDMYFSDFIINYLRFNFPHNGFINLTYVENTGAAFSILQNSGLFLAILSSCIALLLCIYLIRHINKMSALWSFWSSMLVAGIFCNLYERWAFGYVRDFFSLDFVKFPVFNISDILINIGVIALIIIILRANTKN